MNCIGPRLFTQQSILGRKSRFVAAELVVHKPCATSKSQHRIPLPCHPAIVVRRCARMCRRMEETVIAVCQRDVYDCRLREGEEACAQRRAQRPGSAGSEGREDERAVEKLNLLQVARWCGQAWFGGHAAVGLAITDRVQSRGTGRTK
nr:hypothetical protein CFP56_54877 [Quercus suber]